MPNIFSDIPVTIPEEFVDILLRTSTVRIERIVSHGHASPAEFWYDQDDHEWVLLLQGSANLNIDGVLLEMQPGDFVHIPAHQRHRVESTSPDQPTIWLAVFYEGDCDSPALADS